MRDLLALCAMLVFVPLAIRHTFVAYLLWGWAGLISLNNYLYGFMIPVPYVQVFAMIALGSWFWTKDPERRPFAANRTTTLLIIFLVHGLMCALLAYPGLVRNWELYGNMVKTALFCVLMPLLATSRLRIHAIVLMVVLATAFHGALDGLKFLSSGGAHNARGMAKFGDNNQFALVLLMVLPLIYYLYQYTARRWVQMGFAAGALLTVLAIVATASRGALLGLVALAIWVILQSRRKLTGLVLVALMGFMVIQLAPERWQSRMETIKTAEDDSSFMGRVAAWKVNSAIALANPVFGGGFRVVENHPVWDRFVGQPGLLGFVDTPLLSRSGVAAHSIWFEVLGDLGFVGFFIFVALLINTFVTLKEIRALVKRGDEACRWARDLADLVGASMVTYIVSGSLLSAAYFETPYILMMLLEVIKLQLQRKGSTAPPGGIQAQHV